LAGGESEGISGGGGEGGENKGAQEQRALQRCLFAVSVLVHMHFYKQFVWMICSAPSSRLEEIEMVTIGV
jgi:hypothetical protein